jgi:fatty acid desaturase
MSSNATTKTELLADQEDKQQNPHRILSTDELNLLNQRSNWKGLVQFAGHLAIMGLSGYLWIKNFGNWWLAIPALIIYGSTFATMFAPFHECNHRTAFANNRLNDAVGWFCGLLSLYNSSFYRHYHKWHHLYTNIPGKDPELTDLIPSSLGEYLLVISGLPWWQGKISTYFPIAFGQFDDCPFIPEAARREVTRSVRLQFAIYGIAIAFSIAAGQPWFLQYWLFPLVVGQPILRLILLAEHTGCNLDNNFLANTRTTLTLFPIRFLMWNMPFHAEHHLYPSIPFHALPVAHEKLRSHFKHVCSDYVSVHRNIIAKFEKPMKGYL